MSKTGRRHSNRRPPTKVVPGDGKENGREPQPPQDGDDDNDEEEEEEEHDEEEQQRLEKEKQRKAPKERRRSSTRAEDAGAPRHSPARQEAEAQKGRGGTRGARRQGGLPLC